MARRLHGRSRSRDGVADGDEAVRERAGSDCSADRSASCVVASHRRRHRVGDPIPPVEPNRGQAAKPVRFLSRGPRHHVEIFDDGIALASLHQSGGAATSARLSFAGIDATGSFEAREPAAGVANYLTGSDAGTWIRAVPRYRQLRRADLYPGIDLVYYSRGGELEFDLVVKPGADPSRIRMEIGGAATPILAANGDLLLDGADGALRLHRPVLHQHIDGKKKTIDARFVLDGKRRLRFALPAYDKRYSLVIDPVFKLLSRSPVDAHAAARSHEAA